MVGYEAFERTVEVGLILGIAEALRAEFGTEIDAHPGGPGNEAGVVNRAFRAVARRILRSIVPSGEDLGGVVTWVLRLAALRRFGEVGVDGDRAAGLLDQEPGLGDAWLACLALVPGSVLGEILGATL
ncbi:hypothetical protein TA3x_000525 [Tundrisphaera sp. TA3]|uniref:hypothetical protein n=1 Tax=Tundrisphaera sp. TA3 TaxID=3435775 RepID=UPI003EB90DED